MSEPKRPDPSNIEAHVILIDVVDDNLKLKFENDNGNVLITSKDGSVLVTDYATLQHAVYILGKLSELNV